MKSNTLNSVYWNLLFIVLFGVFVHFWILVFGYPQGHDGANHLRWLYHFSSQIREYDFYPRWLNGMSGGYGGPSFYYYPPASYFLLSVLALFADPSVYGHFIMGFGLILISIIGSLGVYIFCVPYITRRYALFGAILFLVMPYRILVDVYMRGDISEISGISVIPFLFLVRKHFNESVLWLFIATTLSTALIVLTHPLVAMIILPFSFFFRAYDAFGDLHSRRKSLGLCFGATGLGMLMSCFYILPALAITNLANPGWEQFIVYDSFLFSRPMSPSPYVASLGLLSILLTMALALLCWLFILIKGSGFFRLAVLFFGFSALTSFMLFEYSEFLYRIFFPLEKMQFPWRYTTALTFFATIGAAFAMFVNNNSIKNKESSRVLILDSLFALLLISLTIVALLIGWKRTSQRYTSADIAALLETSRDIPDYRLADFIKDNEFFDFSHVHSGFDKDIRVITWSENEIVIEGEFERSDSFILSRQYWGNWIPSDETDCGGEKAEACLKVSNTEGLLGVSVEKSLSRISLIREDFAIVRISEMISITSFVLFLVISFFVTRFFNRNTVAN